MSGGEQSQRLKVKKAGLLVILSFSEGSQCSGERFFDRLRMTGGETQNDRGKEGGFFDRLRMSGGRKDGFFDKLRMTGGKRRDSSTGSE